MADVAYNRGLDEWRNIGTDTWKALLLKSTAPAADRDLDFVSDLTPGTYEIAGSGYARVTLGSKTRTIDDTNNRITYGSANPAFGSIVAGETVGRMVVFRFVTNDSDSVLVADYDITDTATNGAPFTPTVNASGLNYIDGT